MGAPGLDGVGVYASWSGGKDCALALHEAVGQGARPRLLLTMMTETGLRSRSHGLARELLRAQADALGLPIRFGAATWDAYEAAFGALVAGAVDAGVGHGVFGDIDTDAHRAWVERVCASAGSAAHLPLWQRDRPALVRQLLAAGFQAHVVAVRDGLLPASLLGERIDAALLRQFERAGVDLAGENGEYHTVVVDGPLFRRPLDVAFGETVLRDGVWFVDAWTRGAAPA